MKLSFPAKFRVRGFALVVTLTLMVLLTLIAVGLLSLSAVSLRGSSQTAAQSEARANARLALMLAIGELQKSMGPDQRVSASGAIVADSTVKHPHWTGVWDSWRAGLPDPSAASPDDESEHSTMAGAANSGMAPTYKSGREDHFRSWLVSLAPDEAERVESAQSLAITGDNMPGKDADSVILVGKESIGPGSDAGDYVSARLLPVRSSTTGSASSGRYGWWVGDESQKARIMDDSYESSAKALTSAEKIFRQQAPGSTGSTTVKGLEAMTDDTQLDGLPSLRSLDLVSGATGRPGRNFHSITPYSYQVLADVREGGLKRDLSTLLERPIDLSESGDEFMLYKFNDNERVPIQDLAAYFQLYHQAGGDPEVGNQGVRYASELLNSGIQITTPDYGGWKTEDKFQRQYTSLYRSPVPIKLQMLFGLLARPAPIPNRYNLGVTLTMSMTLWNPTNLPMVVDTRGKLFQRLRLWSLSLGFQFNINGTITDSDLRLVSTQYTGPDPTIELDVSPNVPLVFAPGEVKVLSIPYNPNVSLDFTRFDGTNKAYMRLLQDWDPDGFMPLARGSIGMFRNGDKLKLTVNANSPKSWQPIFYQLGQTSYHDVGSGQIGLERSFYNYTLASRTGASAEFKDGFMMRGFEGNAPITVDIPTTTLINGSASGVSLPFLNFSMMAGSETSETANASGIGGASGRKFASRPFLHSSAIRPSMIDADSLEAFYNSGWNWWFEPINSVLEAPVQVTPEGNGYYGGGYGPTFGTTHIVQQEIPVVPPMSIASLSHAHLGGFSLSDLRPPQSGGAGWSQPLEPAPLATGRGGLFPNALQAIGNSYAHPQLPAGKAYDDGVQRIFRTEDGPTTVVFADHSYLANKALWDEFFFSSITPQPESVKIFEGPGRSAAQVAEDFLFHEKPLPNRRIVAHKGDLDEKGLDELFAKAGDFSDGLADRIASHLMAEGPFNVNSTSVEAWKVFLSSLKGKPVAYFDKDKAKQGTLQPEVETPDGTPVGAFSLPSGKPTGATNDPADPGQWTGSRELSDAEIGELATAVVKQVKLRGPFLSLSEFVNRRLDPGNPALSVKGALQAALDDDSVSINAAFRTSDRQFSAAEKAGMNPAFPEALEGPVAYGSSAYVDQADILRSFAGQLTPRGDTFVIRTYGDAIDPTGKVVARAWCEAIVQRVPDYVDSTDESHLKQSALKSEANKLFGRKLQIVSFRWLGGSEV
jgi:hypothetical protein